MMKKSFLSAFLIIAGVMASFADGKNGFVIPQEKFVDTLDIDILGWQITVPVEIGGHTFHFLFDTGSTNTFLPSANFPGVTSKEEKATTTGLYGNVTNQALNISEMQIGSLKFNNVHASIYKVPLIDGILGYDLLQAGLIAKFMIKDKKIILTNDPSIFKNEKGKHISFYKGSEKPLFFSEPIKGFKTPTLLDTGNPEAFFLSMDYLRYYASKSNKITKEIKRQVVWYNYDNIWEYAKKYIEPEYFFKFDNIKVEGLNFHQVAGHTTNAPFSLLGTRLLCEFDFIVDAEKKEVIFLTDQKDFNPSTDGVQFRSAFIPNDTKSYISCLNPDCKLAKLGVLPGATIDEVDGIQLDGDDKKLLTKLSLAKKLHRVKLTNPDGKVIEGDSISFDY